MKVYDPISVHVITWYRCGQSTFSSCDHMGGQRKAKMDYSTIRQKKQRIKLKADKTPKRENMLILQQSRCTISWSRYTCGKSTFSSCLHVSGQRKAKMDKSTIGHKIQRIKIKADKTPKRENILILQQSSCTISWSHDTSVDNQHSRHAITWADREKPKWTKSTIGQKNQRIKLKADKTPKKRKYFNTPTIKVYDPMITWYTCGKLTFSSCLHVSGQRKAKMDKSTIGQKIQRIKIKADKTPKRENILILQQSRCTISWSHDTSVDNQHSRHAITWADREKPKWTKSTIGQKEPKDKTQSGHNPQKRKYVNTPTIKVYDPISVHVITWYRWIQSTFLSCDHVGGQRKAKMD